MIHGKDLILTINSEYAQNIALAASKSCEVEVNTDFIEVASPTDGAWKQYVSTYLSWGLSASSLLAYPQTFNTLFAYQTNKTKLTARFFDPDLGIYYKGDVYISNLRNTATVGSLVKISLTFQPTGPLTPSPVTEFRCGGESGGTISGYKIDWSGENPAIVDDTEVVHNPVQWYEIDVANKLKTRISIGTYTMLIKETAANVVTLVEAKDNATLLSKAVLIKKNETGYVVVGPAVYTAIVNNIRSLGNDGSYNSTF